MSWLARSLVNSLRPDHGGGGGDGDGDGDDESSSWENERGSHRAAAEEEEGTAARGVKEDISELTQTLTRQLWGVASFLAPLSTSTPSSPRHPDSPSSDLGRRTDPTASGDSADAAEAESPRLAGIRSDLAEIGGTFKSGISILSGNKAVHEISKLASTFLPFGSEEVDKEEDWEEEESENSEEKFGSDVVGVTDEVLAFARNVSMHPETWLDFPLFHDDEDSDEFFMSEAQQAHALAIEHLASRLTALRIELCPSHMSEGCFWKIYFVLLHPRLNKHDAEILSTPQIVQARAMLLQDLQNQTRRNPERPAKDGSYSKEATTLVPPGENIKLPSVLDDEPTTSVSSTEIETEKHPIQATEVVEVVEKSVIEEEPPVKAKSNDFPSDASKICIQRYEDGGDEWLEEETGETGVSGNEEDVSFSDLEEDDDDGGASTSPKITIAIVSPTKEESGWVQLKKSSDGAVKGGDSANPRQTRESNDWLNVDIDAV